MNTDELLSNIRQALGACMHPRFLDTERGFQGQLLIELSKRIRLPDQAILEQEYQKRLQVHGLNIRPDIVIHEPFDPARHPNRASGNIAVIELKLRANAEQAAADFANITSMLRVLHYPLGIFINISSTETHATLIPNEARGRIVTYAVPPNGRAENVIEVRT